MSIIIKGMDMPKASNEDCIAVIRSNGKVEVWQTGMKEFDAQAIQIPTPHGRLIDADKIPYTDLNDDPKSKVRVYVALRLYRTALDSKSNTQRQTINRTAHKRTART